jgi:hypothetical protein
MFTIFNRRVPRLLAAVWIALTISVPFAAAYIATGTSAAQIEQTSSQIDRSNKGDRLHVSPQAKQIAPKRPEAHTMVA